MPSRLVPPHHDQLAAKTTLVSLMRRYPLIGFFLLAIGLTWGVPYLAGAMPAVVRGILFKPLVPTGFSSVPFSLYVLLLNYGPSVAALVMVGMCDGRSGIREWFSRWTHWRVEWKWYFIALLCAPVLFVCQNLMTRPAELLALPVHSTKMVLHSLVTFPLFLVPFFVVNAGEEGGWRGFAVPRLQARYGPVLASCILGVLWEVWHLQAILWPGNPYYAQGPLAVSLHLLRGLLIWNLYAILGTWIFNRTRGSLLPVTLWHASLNVTANMETQLFPTTGASLPGHALGDWILWPIVVIGIIWLTRGRLGYQENEKGTGTASFGVVAALP